MFLITGLRTNYSLLYKIRNETSNLLHVLAFNLIIHESQMNHCVCFGKQKNDFYIYLFFNSDYSNLIVYKFSLLLLLYRIIKFVCTSTRLI